MPEPVTLARVKADNRLDPGPSADDGTLTRYITAARRMVELKTGRVIVGDAPDVAGDDLATACQAISMIVGAWYANPEAISADGRGEMPLGVSWITESLKRWDDGGDE
jgi:hypothetical protein